MGGMRQLEMGIIWAYQLSMLTTESCTMDFSWEAYFYVSKKKAPKIYVPGLSTLLSFLDVTPM